MCGIIFSLYSDETDKKIILQNVQSIKHRGPENTNIIDNKEDKYILGFHRLKIIGNNEIGNQPLLDKYWVFACNGEIYNYKDLSTGYDLNNLRSDVEIIPKLLEIDINNWKNGQNKSVNDAFLKTFKKFDGDFACIYLYKDTHGNKTNIIVARDHIGLCPLYYALDENENIIAFASEVKALISLQICKQIKQFPPGYFVHQELSNIKENNFLKYNSDDIIQNAANTIRVLVESAVNKRLKHSDRQVGVLCSGGIDSSIIAAIANRQNYNNLPLNIFTISYNTGTSYDSFYANKLCTLFKNSIHTNIVFTKKEVINAIENVIKTCETSDPRTIRAAIPGYLLAKYISENTSIKVILSGEGADELFAGYKYFQYSPDSESLQKESTRLINNLHSFDLLRAERVFSAFGLELRVPFLDQNLIGGVKCFEKIMFDFKLKEKFLLRKAFEIYPELVDVINRQKECFSDGCGYDYVPDLLRMHSDSSKLDVKEENEKEFYLELFEKYYGNIKCSWILKRIMPDWIPNIDTPRLLCYTSLV
jgi:asparagine synthase (glutamine-hydrolysing)